MLNVIGRGKGAKLRIIPASGKGLRASSNIANPVPASTGWTEIAPGVWECDGVTVGAATTLILAQEADGLVIGQSYLLSATITGTADILIRSGSTTLDTNWDGSPKVFTPDNGNFNIFQRAGGYTIQSIVIREAVIAALGVESASEVGAPTATIIAPAATGVESLSEVGLANKARVAIGVESASEVGSPTVTILAPVAVGVESASEVGTIPVDTVAPTMTDDTYDEGTTTFSATLDEDAILHVLVSDAEPLTINDIILGTGLRKTTYAVTLGSNTDPIEFSTVPAGTHWLGIQPVDAAGNADFAQAHVAEYVFPGGYVATGVESVSEVGAPVAQGMAPAATGVESASEVGAPTATILASAATGVESTSEVGSPSATIEAPAATGVESASEIGTAAPPATGGASGNFTFSLVQDLEKADGGDPASVTLTTGITEGNILVAYCGMRADNRSHTTHQVTDSNGKTWTKGTGNDNLITDPNSRCCASIWWRVIESSASEGDTTPIVSFDDNATDGGTTNMKFMQVCEYHADSAYDWTWRAGQILGAGTGEWDDGSNPSASPSGDDIFEVAFALGRHGTSSLPTEGGTSFATQTDGVAWGQVSTNQMTIISAFEATSQAAGSKSADLTSDSTGCEGLVGIATWSDG